MQCIAGVGVARDQRAWDSDCSFNQIRYEIAASPHPAVLRTSTLPIKGRVVPGGARSKTHYRGWAGAPIHSELAGMASPFMMTVSGPSWANLPMWVS